MKKIKSIQLLVLSASLLFLTLSACKKDKTADEVTPEPSNGSLMFHLHTMVDTNEVEAYGDTVVLTGGTRMAVTTAQLYLSNIKLIKTDGTVIEGPATTVFMKQGVEEYELGSAPAGNYKSVRFDVGLSNSDNASNPLSTNSILYQPSMWYGATAQPDGFVFVNFQGLIDTSAVATGANLVPFAYKIGTAAHRITITLPDKNFTITPDQQAAIHMEVDYNKLLNGVQVNQSANLSLTSVAQNSSALANKIAANISDLFSAE